jgi:UDP-N-acetylglucosamine--N-acetylmuramyl-(pentapeptide) pyrophosphoryl-undecaprenol N-acetylglucosamine transferase
MGGYAAVGPVLAARRHRVPVVLHESNAIPGRACSLLARFAAAVAVHFPVTQDYFRHPRIVVTGMPLRPQLKVEPTASAAKPAAPTPFTVLVMGGSQGAHALNAVATAALIQASSRGLALRAIHLAGVRDEAAVRRAYAEAGVSAEVHAFLAEMWAAYDAATFAICRSGAATCAELAAFGLPALLIPYPHASRGHQKANAQALKAAGAADWMDQDGVNAMWLTEYVLALAANREKRARMRAAALQVAIRDAEDRLAELVESVART